MGNSAGAITTIIGITYYLNIIFKPALDRSFQLQAQRMKIQLLRARFPPATKTSSEYSSSETSIFCY